MTTDTTDLRAQTAALLNLKGYTGLRVPDQQYPEAAVMVPLLGTADGLAVVLTRRAAHLKLHAGEAAFPGGKRDPEDRDLLATALREAQEEIDLAPDLFTWLFTLDQRVTRTDIKVTPFVGLIPSNAPMTPNPDEIEELYTVPVTWFSNPDNLSMIELPYHGGLITSPCFRYGRQTIWGVTAMTLIDLVNTAFAADIELPLQLTK